MHFSTPRGGWSHPVYCGRWSHPVYCGRIFEVPGHAHVVVVPGHAHVLVQVPGHAQENNTRQTGNHHDRPDPSGRLRYSSARRAVDERRALIIRRRGDVRCLDVHREVSKRASGRVSVWPKRTPEAMYTCHMAQNVLWDGLTSGCCVTFAPRLVWGLFYCSLMNGLNFFVFSAVRFRIYFEK